MGRHSSESPVKARGSPRRRSLSRRERSPARHRSSNTDKLSTHNRSPKRARSRSPVFHSPVRDKPYHRTKSPDHRKSPPARSRSPVRQKPSNRTRSPEKGKPQIRNRSPRRERSRSLDSPSPSPRGKRLKRVTAERDSQKGNDREHERRDLTNEKKDRRSERDAVGNGSRSRHGRSDSPPDRHHRGRRRSRSPVAADSRGHNEWTNSRDPEQRDDDSDSIAKMKAVEETLDAKDKQKPSFELSGKLAAETNRVRGVTLLFNEPADARKPDIRWRLYVFKGGEVLNEPLYVHRQSCYLFGRERRVADIPTDHPSCSKQHAVLQYRQVEEENPDGTMSKRVRPYLMDLGSTNGTFINDNQMEPQRYYELFEKDTIKFGNSSREYVLLHENSSG